MSNRSCLALVLLLIGAASALTQEGPGPPRTAVPAGPRFAKIRPELERLVSSGALPSVAVGVVRRGQVEWAEAFGLADRAGKVPATVDTPYRIASMGKAMTATAVMTLVEGGRLQLEARVDEILRPGVLRVLAGDRAPTVREVLDMTAGIPHGAATYRVPDPPTESEVLKRHAMVVFPPGETFHYSNFSMAVADAVIEAVTRGAFADYLHENVFAPLQMTHSTLGDPGGPPAAARP